MFVKEYYIQIPFIIMRFVFHMAGEDDVRIAKYIECIINKLKLASGILDDIDMVDMQQGEVSFEEMLFLRIGYEFTKMYRADRSQAYIDHMDKIALSFEHYSVIFTHLLMKDDNMPLDVPPDRLIFSEWVKFSLQLAIEDEVTRRNLVSLMFTYIGQVGHSYRDYQHMLKYKRIAIRDSEVRSVELAMDDLLDEEEFDDAT